MGRRPSTIDHLVRIASGTEIPDDVRERIKNLALDEPALSPRELAVRFTDTEGYFVSEAIGRLAHQKTLMIIAHRLTTVVACDRIVQLDEGRIVRAGTCDELAAGSKNENIVLIAS